MGRVVRFAVVVVAFASPMAAGGTSIGVKGMMVAAKDVALTAMRMKPQESG